MLDSDFERIKQGLTPQEGGRAKRALDALRALESEVGSRAWLTKAIDECHALIHKPKPTRKVK
jgi:hypothetical protein